MKPLLVGILSVLVGTACSPDRVVTPDYQAVKPGSTLEKALVTETKWEQTYQYTSNEDLKVEDYLAQDPAAGWDVGTTPESSPATDSGKLLVLARQTESQSDDGKTITTTWVKVANESGLVTTTQLKTIPSGVAPSRIRLPSGVYLPTTLHTARLSGEPDVQSADQYHEKELAETWAKEVVK